jgi:hypothetical protein
MAATGEYEFRLFDGSNVRLATSSKVTVTPAPVLEPTLTAAVSSAPAGSPVTVSLTGGPGGSTDWIALALVGSPDTSNVAWTYVGSDVTARTWSAILPTTGPAAYEFRLFLDNGYTRAATSAPVMSTVPPGITLSVNTTLVQAGRQVTVTLTGGPGGAKDWLAFASTTAASTSYLQWTYVGAGVTTRTWTVTVPATAGTYEFRLFLNDGFTRAATSPAVMVTP